jgi:hypothetical protein
MKTTPALTLLTQRGAQPWIPISSHLVISTEYRPPTMKMGLNWLFLALILKGHLWGARNTEYMS